MRCPQAVPCPKKPGPYQLAPAELHPEVTTGDAITAVVTVSRARDIVVVLVRLARALAACSLVVDVVGRRRGVVVAGAAVLVVTSGGSGGLVTADAHTGAMMRTRCCSCVVRFHKPVNVPASSATLSAAATARNYLPVVARLFAVIMIGLPKRRVEIGSV